MPTASEPAVACRSSHLVLLSLDWIRPKDPRTSLGHASLLARLSTVQGLRVSPLSFAVNDPAFRKEVVLAAVLDRLEQGSDFAVGVYVWNDALVRWLLPTVRAMGFAGRIILGGPQVSYAAPGVDRQYPDADIFVRGHGEDALAGVMGESAALLTGVTRQGADDRAAPARVDLASLPSPLLSGVLPANPFQRWETQRGCIFRCSFCQHREPEARLRAPTLGASRLEAEIDAMVQGGVRDIAVLDPIFELNPQAVSILRRFRERGYSGRLSLQCRFEGMRSDFLDACAGLDVRLEFGLQTTQVEEMRAIDRVNNLPRVEAAIIELRRRGIPFEVSLIYGLPNQTVESFRDSVAWCRDRGVEVIRAFPLMLLRGTPMDRDRAKWALVESADPIPVVVESASFSRADWLEMKQIATELGGEEGNLPGRPLWGEASPARAEVEAPPFGAPQGLARKLVTSASFSPRAPAWARRWRSTWSNWSRLP